MRLGVLEIEPSGATLAGRPLALRPLELRLLQHLATHTDRVQTRRNLLDAVWGVHPAGGGRTVDAYVARLRRALGAAGDAIVTVRRVGYRLDPSILGVPVLA